MGDMDNDLVMESTTDTPDQIAAGLSITLADDAGVQAGADETGETAPPEPAAESGEEAPAVSAGSEEAAADEDADSPVVVTPHQTQRAEAPRTPRPQRKSVDGAAAAARRRASADRKVLEEENAALRRRLEQLATGTPASAPAATAAPAARTIQPVDPSAVPDTHPQVAAVLTKIAALVRPKQDDFSDYDDFEAKKEEFLIAKARLEARLDLVREDVARQETAILEEANRAAQETAQSFERSVQAARSRYADYDDVMAAATEADLRLPQTLLPVISESAIGADLVYYLSKNPTELNRISALSPHRAAAEVGKIEDRITASLTRPGHRPAAPARPAARTTRAPEPPSVTLGDLGANVRGAKDINDPNLSQAEYNRLRDEMDIASGRRRA